MRAASRRQKWIDQAQSLNLYVAAPNGRKLDELYRLAWHTGCKTTYYLRSTSATHVEKSTLRGTDGRLNAVVHRRGAASSAPRRPRRGARRPRRSAAAPIVIVGRSSADALACSIDNPDCEACQ